MEKTLIEIFRNEAMKNAPKRKVVSEYYHCGKYCRDYWSLTLECGHRSAHYKPQWWKRFKTVACHECLKESKP
jgi:hypothetical protein